MDERGVLLCAVRRSFTDSVSGEREEPELRRAENDHRLVRAKRRARRAPRVGKDHRGGGAAFYDARLPACLVAGCRLDRSLHVSCMHGERGRGMKPRHRPNLT